MDGRGGQGLWSPLHSAAENGLVSSAKLLLEGKANIDALANVRVHRKTIGSENRPPKLPAAM